MRIDEALKAATETLIPHSDSARLDTELLLCHFLDKPRSYLYAWPEKKLDPPLLASFLGAVETRTTGYPIAYITGKQEFWSLPLMVNESVLIPRADTELLVETTLKKLEEIASPTVLELGTGSGAIALAIGSERPDADILATDWSQDALKVAESNRRQLSLNNIRFIHSDWYQSVPSTLFDVIISNPPYIDPKDAHMKTGIRFEPVQALCADNSGMADLVSIIEKAGQYLKPSGWILLEHGYDQKEPVLQSLNDFGFQHAQCLQDLAGNDRICLGQKP